MFIKQTVENNLHQTDLPRPQLTKGRTQVEVIISANTIHKELTQNNNKKKIQVQV